VFAYEGSLLLSLFSGSSQCWTKTAQRSVVKNKDDLVLLFSKNIDCNFHTLSFSPKSFDMADKISA
jgi:hypothetical protein